MILRYNIKIFDYISI